jgi:hypothetical protein
MNACPLRCRPGMRCIHAGVLYSPSLAAWPEILKSLKPQVASCLEHQGAPGVETQ